jgi:hypothetical protein
MILIHYYIQVLKTRIWDITSTCDAVIAWCIKRLPEMKKRWWACRVNIHFISVNHWSKTQSCPFALIKHYALKTYGRMDIHVLLASAVVLVSLRARPLYPPVPVVEEMGGPQSRFWRGGENSWPYQGSDSVIQHVACRWSTTSKFLPPEAT